jgi:hypothetical protein
MDIDPRQAYLVGLCHSVGSLPEVLGWGGNREQRLDRISVGLLLAREWSLPSCVFDYFSEGLRCGTRSRWLEIVRAAHRCAGQLPAECVPMMGLGHQLLHAV